MCQSEWDLPSAGIDIHEVRWMLREASLGEDPLLDILSTVMCPECGDLVGPELEESEVVLGEDLECLECGAEFPTTATDYTHRYKLAEKTNDPVMTPIIAKHGIETVFRTPRLWVRAYEEYCEVKSDISMEEFVTYMESQNT